MGKSLARKNMQVWMADPAEQAYVKHMGWDGALKPATNATTSTSCSRTSAATSSNYVETQTTSVDVTLEGSDARVSTKVAMHNGVFLRSLAGRWATPADPPADGRRVGASNAHSSE